MHSSLQERSPEVRAGTPATRKPISQVVLYNNRAIVSVRVPSSATERTEHEKRFLEWRHPVVGGYIDICLETKTQGIEPVMRREMVFASMRIKRKTYRDGKSYLAIVFVQTDDSPTHHYQLLEKRALADVVTLGTPDGKDSLLKADFFERTPEPLKAGILVTKLQN